MQLSYLKIVINDLKITQLIQISARWKHPQDAGFIATPNGNNKIKRYPIKQEKHVFVIFPKESKRGLEKLRVTYSSMSDIHAGFSKCLMIDYMSHEA